MASPNTVKDTDVVVTYDNGHPSAIVLVKDSSTQAHTETKHVPCHGSLVLANISQRDQLRSLAMHVSTNVHTSWKRTINSSWTEVVNTPAKKWAKQPEEPTEKSLKPIVIPLKITVMSYEGAVALEMAPKYLEVGAKLVEEKLEAAGKFIFEQVHREPYLAQANLFVKAGGEIKEVALPEDSKTLHIFLKNGEQGINSDDVDSIERIARYNKGTVHRATNKPGYWGFLKFRNEQDATNAYEDTKAQYWNKKVFFKKPGDDDSVVFYKFTLGKDYHPPEQTHFLHLQGHQRIKLDEHVTIRGKNIVIRKANHQNYATVEEQDGVKSVSIKKVIEYLKRTYNLDVAKIEKNEVTGHKSTIDQNARSTLQSNVRNFLDSLEERFHLSSRVVTTYYDQNLVNVTVAIKDPEEAQLIEKGFQGDKLKILREDRHSRFGGRINYTIDISHHVLIKRSVYSVVYGGVDTLRQAIREKYGDRVRLEEDVKKNGDVKVILKADHRLTGAFRASKTVLQKILTPAKIKCTKDHRHCFESPLGRTVVRSLENEYDVKIIVEGTKIQVFGHPSGIASCSKDLRPMIEDCMKRAMIIDLTDFGEGLNVVRMLQHKFGFHLEGLNRRIGSVVAVDCMTAQLHVKGYDAMKRVMNVLDDLKRQGHFGNGVKLEDGAVCCACFTPPEHPFMRLGLCGHLYCCECLLEQITAAISSRTIPIVCAEDGCNRPILWQDLKMVLRNKPEVLDQILQVALGLYVSCNTDAIRFCPTPDCNMFYYAGVQGGSPTIICSSCSAEICAVCNVPSHKGTPCAQHKMAAADFPKDLKNWMEEIDNGTRKMCPRCTHCIEKNGGCPHVVCASCRTSICWNCDLYFSSIEDINDHFQNVSHAF